MLYYLISITGCINDSKIIGYLHPFHVVNGVGGHRSCLAEAFILNCIINNAEAEWIAPFHTKDVINHSIDDSTFTTTGNT